MSKWIKKSDCEGKNIWYVCDKCGFDDGWEDYKLCPMCGDKKETVEDGGTELVDDVPFICVRFDCKHNYNAGLCMLESLISPLDLKCPYYEVRNNE